MLPPAKWNLNNSNPLWELASYGGIQKYRVCNDNTSKNSITLDVEVNIELKPGDCQDVETVKMYIKLKGKGTASGTVQIIP